MFSGFSRVAQEQTENALCRQTPDRRTSEQLQNLQGETQTHLSASLLTLYEEKLPASSATQSINTTTGLKDKFTLFQVS